MKNYRCSWGCTSFDPACDACESGNIIREEDDYKYDAGYKGKKPKTFKELQKKHKKRYDDYMIHNSYDDFM